MGKSKRSAKKPSLQAKKARTLPPIHNSQECLAQRAARFGEDEAIIIVAPPGYGKTRAIGRYIKLREEGQQSLTVYVGATAYMCHKQSFEVGSDFQYSFQYASQHRPIKAMLMDGRSVVTTMTPSMFNKLVFGDAESRVVHKADR